MINLPENLSSDEISNTEKLEKEKEKKNVQSNMPVEVSYIQFITPYVNRFFKIVIFD